MTSIDEPTLLLDEDIARRNIRRAAEKAQAGDCLFKPHFKTHQSHTVGRWFRDYGVEAITVSSCKMAEYFAKDGWNDITIAFPFNPRTAPRLNALARKVELSLMLSDPDTFQPLQQTITEPVGIYIEIDTGSGRTGFLPTETQQIGELAEKLKEHPTFRFNGFYSHPGHSYRCRSRSEIRDVHEAVVSDMQALRSRFESETPALDICIGDTPCCSAGTDFDGITEISPGNLVFYDLMQHAIGACSIDDIAVALACPVVGVYPKRNEIVVHGGAIHLSKERLGEDSDTQYGRVVSLNQDLSWSAPIGNSFVKSLSQEHGVISCNPQLTNEVRIGDLLGVLPVHSCLTADAMAAYRLTHSGGNAGHLQGNL